MPHVKFQDHRILFLEEKILNVLTVSGRGGYVDHVTWTIYTDFRFPEIWL